MKIISIDFDGTCVVHKFPGIGKEAPHCIEVLNYLQNNGWKIILNTMRGTNQCLDPISGIIIKKNNSVNLPSLLEDAVNWLESRGINLYGINNNPTQWTWTNSRKIYANYYVDDAAIGVPMITLSNGDQCVDWIEVLKEIEEKEGED